MQLSNITSDHPDKHTHANVRTHTVLAVPKRFHVNNHQGATRFNRIFETIRRVVEEKEKEKQKEKERVEKDKDKMHEKEKDVDTKKEEKKDMNNYNVTSSATSGGVTMRPYSEWGEDLGKIQPDNPLYPIKVFLVTKAYAYIYRVRVGESKQQSVRAREREETRK